MSQGHALGSAEFVQQNKMNANDDTLSANLMSDTEWRLELGEEDERLELDFFFDAPQVAATRGEESKHKKSEEGRKKRKCGSLGGPSPSRRSGKKKPKGMPKRPLSAYNIFFQHERVRIYENAQDRVTFEDLGKVIGKRWRQLTDEEKRTYDALAETEIQRYRKERDAFEEIRRERMSAPAPATGKDEKSSNPTPPLTQSCSSQAIADHPSAWAAGPSLAVPPPASFPNPTAGRRSDANPKRLKPSPSCASYNSVSSAPTSSYPSTYGGADSSHYYHARSLPSGMELLLSDQFGQDRVYKVEYSCYRMTIAEADEYMLRLSDYVARYGRPLG